MRFNFLILLTILTLTAAGQKLEYRHDSLFVNSFFVDVSTSKSFLDSLLQTSGKTKSAKDKYKDNPVTGKKVKQTTIFYYDKGLFFRKYDYDSTQLSIGIKLYRDTDPQNDRESELTETFKGQLYIAGNYINDNRQIDKLQDLENCSVTVSEATVGSFSTIIGGDILYGENVIRLSFDRKTKELIAVFIHHNFKDR